MKRFFLLLCFSTLICAQLLADGITAALQNGDSVRVFYGTYALQQAYEAANDGATIVLSPGLFYPIGNIEKSITIIGSSAYATNDSELTQLVNLSPHYDTISANNVHIEGIFFPFSLQLANNIHNCHLTGCKMPYLLSSGDHTNTVVDQCLINVDCAIYNGINYCIKNSTLQYFSGTPTPVNDTIHSAYVTNCYIKFWFNDYKNGQDNSPKAIYKNNVLGLLAGSNYSGGTYSLSINARSEFYNNFFWLWYKSGVTSSRRNVSYSFQNGCINSGNSAATSSELANDYSKFYYDMHRYSIPVMMQSGGKVGTDGTPVGITGGTGFSEHPSIPRVTGKTIDSNTDAQGNINVKITVEVK